MLGIWKRCLICVHWPDMSFYQTALLLGPFLYALVVTFVCGSLYHEHNSQGKLRWEGDLATAWRITLFVNVLHHFTSTVLAAAVWAAQRHTGELSCRSKMCSCIKWARVRALPLLWREAPFYLLQELSWVVVEITGLREQSQRFLGEVLRCFAADRRLRQSNKSPTGYSFISL